MSNKALRIACIYCGHKFPRNLIDRASGLCLGPDTYIDGCHFEFMQWLDINKVPIPWLTGTTKQVSEQVKVALDRFLSEPTSI